MRRPSEVNGPGSRVLIIGLDGGTWSVLDRFMGLGKMPFLAEFSRRGHRADLLSTDPAITPVAWSSFATGMNPGKHGVFGFLSPQSEPGSYFPPPVRRDGVRAPSLWRRVSEAGLRAVVLSVPLTYPPEAVNGFVVSGMFTPEEAADSTHPRSLASELAAIDAMPKFRLDFSLKAGKGRREEELARALEADACNYFADLDDMTGRLGKAALHLGRQPWDLMVVVFMGTDRLQHVLWNEVVGCSPDSALGKRICDFYGRVDEAIAELVTAAGDDTVTIVMSDHGFGPCHGSFGMTRWLIDQGYASHRPRRLYGTARAALDATGMKGLAARMMSKRRGVARAVRRSFIPLDWSRTRAFFQSGTYGIRLNVRGRENEGIVAPDREYESLRQELIERVQEIRDPSTGARVIAAARPSEEVYAGPEVRWAPDIILHPDPRLGHHLVPGNPIDTELIRPDPKTRGSHRREGVLAVGGRGVRRDADRRPRSIEDVAPTALWLLGLPVPSDLDGEGLRDLFEGTPRPRGIPGGATPRPRADGAGEYTEEEQAEIVERLRNLGYVD